MSVDAEGTATLLKKKTKAKVVQDEDFLQSTAAELENLSKDQAFTLADTLLEQAGTNDFKLGGVLSVIQTHGWFEGYPSFRAMVDDRFKMHYRKALYLVQIYNDLVENQIPWEKVKGLGWTKLKEIAKLLTPSNVDEWVARAKSMTVLQLKEYVSGAKKKAKSGSSETISTDVSTMTFKVHQDQKDIIRAALDKAKDETHTDVDTVALTNICTGYVAGTVAAAVLQPENVSLEDLLKKHGYMDVLMAFDKVFPEVNITVDTTE